jgi:hypothetical protein
MPRLAAKVVVLDSGNTDKKKFNTEDFRRIMNSQNFIGAVAFWRAIEGLAKPELMTRVHAEGVLHAMAESHYELTRGIAYSPQHAECFRYCGFEPVRLASLGELAC